uniref:CW-type domain-containing protein n=1 Tax=Manihot esculenta TaxID=3983 RepID=A0A251IRL0_MANES
MMCSTSELDRCLKFSQKDNAGGRVSSGDFTDTASVDRGIGLACESGSIVGFMPGKSLVDECGVDGGYLNDKKSGIDDCIVETDGLYVEKAGSNDENGGLVNSLEDYGASPELMPMSGSLGNSDQLIEQKDEGSGSVQREMEDKIGGSETETVTCGKMMSSSDCEMPAELISMDALSRNGLEQDMQESIASLEMVMVVIENKSVGLSRIQTDNNNQMCSSLGHGTLSEQITTIGMQSNCFQQEDQKDDKIINTSSAEEFTEVMKVSHVIETTTHDQLSSCEDFEKSLEPMLKIGFSEKIIQLDELKDDGSISASSEDFREIGSQPCQPLGFAENGSCKKLDLPNLLGKDVFGAIYSGTAADHSGQTDNERKDCAGNDGPSEIKCPDIGLSLQKSIQKIRTTRAARNGKNKGNVQDSQVFKAERRKRSCFSKPARSSNWGLLGNITQIFEQSNGLEFNEIRNHGPAKTKDGQGSVKQSRTWKNSQAGGSSQKSRGEKHASISGIRLKVKVGKEVPHNGLNIMVPEVIDTSASACGGVSGFESKSYRGTSSEIPNFVNSVEDTALQERTEEQLQCFLNKLEANVYSDASSSELHVADKDLNGILTSQKSVGDALGDYLGVHSHVDALRGVVEKSHADPGTSPDSEVINVAPEVPVNSGCQEDFLNAVLTSSQDFVAPGLITGINRGKKKDRLTCANDCFPEHISPPMASKNIVKAKKNDKGRQKKVGGFFSNEIHSSPTGANASINSSSSKEFSEVQLHLSKETEHGVSKEDFQVEVSAETKICSGLDDEHVLSESHNSNRLLPSAKYKECQLPRKSAASKGRSEVSDKAKRKRSNGYRQKQNEEKSIYENKVKQNNDRSHIIRKAENDAETVIVNLDMASKDVMDQHLPVDNAWVRCDDCHKWRRIPVALVDSIGQTNCEWICKDNMDTAFADCSIPQEKSNAEINAELGLSDADEDAYDIPSKDKGLECMRTIVSKEHEFTCISTNQFLHRSRKTQTIDEIMVCHCKPPVDGGLGCGDECLNRMLNIECVQGTCPCGDLCSNQQFQKRTYARMKWDRCGKKGFGLRLEEDIFKGKFLIEYLGEVLDMRTYEARQREYASKGHKHFYFMTLDGSEV